VENFVDQCVRLIETHQAWAGLIVGLLAFGESLILIGILLPGTTVLVIVGGLVGAGLISPAPVVLAAIVGAALGDLVSYYLGVRLGRGVVHKWPLNRYRREIARARLFFHRYDFVAVFLGRFFGPIRATVPLVAGMMGMNRHRFQLANILSALVWAPAILASGWLVAKGAGELIRFSATNILVLAAIVIVAAIIVALVGLKLLAGGGGRERSRNRASRPS
jgi:membrane protein DedA with SNARE-associated domain